jgi:hypothetical protein
MGETQGQLAVALISGSQMTVLTRRKMAKRRGRRYSQGVGEESRAEVLPTHGTRQDAICILLPKPSLIFLLKRPFIDKVILHLGQFHSLKNTG